MWNILDFINNSLYVATIALRVIAYVQVGCHLAPVFAHSLETLFAHPLRPMQNQKEISSGIGMSQRENWDDFDPILLSEGLFAAANIFSSLKLVYIFSVNPYLGPLQISLGRMVIDILKFFSIYLLVLFSFACGMNQLLWHYADMEKQTCDLHQQKALTSPSVNTSAQGQSKSSLHSEILHPDACFIYRRFTKSVPEAIARGLHDSTLYSFLFV